MSFTLRQDASDAPETVPTPETGNGNFRLSTEPVVAASAVEPAPPDAAELPRSYGTELLCLIPRDPRTIYAYWDVDWENAFAGEPPSDRKVHLRIRSETAGETTFAVEPMAGYCYVDVADGDAAYTADLGYYQPAGTWNSIAKSDTVTTPADAITTGNVDFATVPFHLSFDRMLDELRRAKQESAALTAMLNDLRERAASAAARSTFTPGQQEIATAIEQAAPATSQAQPPSVKNGSAPRDLWSTGAMSSLPIRSGTSPHGGFGGSSRA